VVNEHAKSASGSCPAVLTVFRGASKAGPGRVERAGNIGYRKKIKKKKI
jgi:hypothetical protein